MSQSPFPPPLPDPRGDDFDQLNSAPDVSQSSPPVSQFSPDKRGFFRRTILEACALFVFNIFLGAALRKLGWNFLLPSMENIEGIESLIRRPLMLLLLAVIIAPLWEEIAFRGLPSLLLRRVRRTRDTNTQTRDGWYWALAIVTSVAFAIAHGISTKGTPHFPVPQFIMGFYLWRAAMDRGLRFSMLLHATYNSILVILAILVGSSIPKNAPQPQISAPVVFSQSSKTPAQILETPIVQVTAHPVLDAH